MFNNIADLYTEIKKSVEDITIKQHKAVKI